MVQKGKESEAEECGEDEDGSIGLNERCAERLPDLQTKEIAKHGDAQNGYGNDSHESNNSLAAFGLYLLAMDATHGGEGEVGRQTSRFRGSKGLTEGAWVS